MIIIEEYKQKFNDFKKDLETLERALKIADLRVRIEEDEALTAEAGFWDDIANSQKVLQVIKNNKKTVENYEKMVSAHEDLGALLEMAEMEPEEMEEEVVAEFADYEKKLEAANLQTLLSGEFDQNNAILTFHAGAGGTEAQDWVEMLYRMYLRFAQRHDYKVTVLDYLDGDEAGIKSASIMVECTIYSFEIGGTVVHYCPICGLTDADDSLLRIIDNASAVSIDSQLPNGTLILRRGTINGDTDILCIVFEHDGKAESTDGCIRISVPAEAVKNAKLVEIDVDGGENELIYSRNDGMISFELNFGSTGNSGFKPAKLIRLDTE